MGQKSDRAVSEVLGLILVFGILMMLLGMYQVFMVPSANEQIEFKHNQQVQGELIDLRNGIMTQQSSDSPTSKTVNLGMEYPSRLLALNPTNPQGTLSTTEVEEGQEISIYNVLGVNNDVATHLNGTPIYFETKHLHHQPKYNEFQSAPDTFIENSVVFNKFSDNNNLTLADQRLIRGNNIQIGIKSGEESYDQREASIDLNPLSSGMTTTQIKASDGPIEVVVPTNLGQDDWDALLASEMESEGGYVKSAEVSDGYLTIELVEGDDERYNLKMANIGVSSNVQDEDEHYLFKKSGHNQSAQQSEQATVEVEVRDRFNNPVSGVPVEFEGGDIRWSDENGIAEYTFTTHDQNATQTITATTASIDNGVDNPSENPGKVTFDIHVGAFNLPDFGTQVNPTTGLVLEDAIYPGGQGDRTEVELYFKGVGEITIEDFRVNTYVSQEPGGSPNQEALPSTMVIEDESGATEEFDIPGGYEEFSLHSNFDDEEEHVYTVTFEEDDGSTWEPLVGDFMMISISFDGEASSTYIVSPRTE